MDCSPPGSSVHGILQARALEWVAMPSLGGSSQPRDRTCVSWVWIISCWASREALSKLGICSKNCEVATLQCNRVSHLSTIDIWGRKILWNALQDVSSPSSLYPLDASGNPPPAGRDNQTCLQTWPAVPCLAKPHPSIENHCIRNTKAMSKHGKVSEKSEQCDKEFLADSWVYSYHLTKEYSDLSDLIMHLTICCFKKIKN